MNTKTDLGAQLYQLLPTVYRERDNTDHSDADSRGDLAKYLDANGELLTQIYYTLKQQLYDNFPDLPEDDTLKTDDEGIARTCQPWLLPYFADLLDVNLVSPDVDGQRAEISNAIAWRQSKGTLPCLESIAESVGQFEAEVQEGFKRIVTTARIGDPLLPAILFSEDAELDGDLPPSEKARHPGMPHATMDFRYRSRVVKTDANDPAANYSKLGEDHEHWVHKNPAGVPCFPNSYQDVSRRTVDFRHPRAAQMPDADHPQWPNRGQYQPHGLYHPRKLLCFYPISDGFFGGDAQSVHWSEIEFSEDFEHDQLSVRVSSGVFDGRSLPVYFLTGLDEYPVKIRGVKRLEEDAIYYFENLWIDNELTVPDGQLHLEGCAVRNVILSEYCNDEPVLDAKSSLIKAFTVASGRVHLEYCTVLTNMIADTFYATDCLLGGWVEKGHRPFDEEDDPLPQAGCVRYTRAESELLNNESEGELSVNASTCHSDTVLFVCNTFGDPGCGVLLPGNPDSIKYGAEDGGEMGAFHEQRHLLKLDAILDKLDDFIPLGMEAVLIPDSTLDCTPPRDTSA